MGALTDRAISGLKKRAKAYQVADGEGLVLEVRPSGQKAWLYRYRLSGRAEKLSLGTYPAVSLANARKLHFAAQQDVAQGKSPTRTKQEERRRLSDDLQTVRGLAKAYIERHIAKLVSRKQPEGWIRNEIVPKIGSRYIHEVTPADCIAIIERIQQRGAPAVARKVLEQLRGMFSYAVDRHLLTLNPAAQIKASKIVGPKRTRERVLSRDQFKPYFEAIEALPTSQANRIAFRLILLTLCRKGELVRAEKAHVHLERGEWVVPAENSKTKQEHIVYLSRQAAALFAELIKLGGTSKWLMPGLNPTKHIRLTTLNQAVYVARKQTRFACLKDVTIHDLRRTASTHLHEMGWPSDVVEKALAHTIGGVRGVYNRAEYAEQRKEMLQQWADVVDAWAAGQNIVSGRFGKAA